MSKRRRDPCSRGGSQVAPIPTREPRIPGDESYPQTEVFLTGDEAEECVGVRIHGQLHYLHAPSSRALERRLHAVLETWNQSIRDFKRSHPDLDDAKRIQEA